MRLPRRKPTSAPPVPTPRDPHLIYEPYLGLIIGAIVYNEGLTTVEADAFRRSLGAMNAGPKTATEAGNQIRHALIAARAVEEAGS